MMLIIMSLIIIGITVFSIINDQFYSDNSFKIEKTTAKTFTRERHNMNVIVAEKPMFVMSIQRHKY